MASNPYVNKVQLADGRSLIDISDTTATADKILEGYTAYGANGQKLTGTASGSGSGVVWQDAQGYVHLSDDGDVPLQTKSATPSETAQSVTPDAGYYALSKVDVGAISPTYVGSEVARRTSSDLTASGATVTAPAGYYASSASKSVATTTHPNPTASVNSSTGVVTASHTQGTGYVTGGTTTGTLNLTTQAAKTVTPSTSSQTAVAAGRYTTGAVTVAAMPSGSVTSPTSISGTSATVSTGTNTLTLSKTVSVTPRVTTAGYISSGTAGNSSVSLTASVTTKSAATITPGTANQTIASGTYLTGTQTISGDSNLVAENIAEGVSIFGVAGTHAGGASNIVEGTFQSNSTGTQTITVPYTGSGYPIIAIVEITGGMLNPNVSNWYNTERNYSVGLWIASKNERDSSPRYRYDYASILSVYKVSDYYTSNFNREVYYTGTYVDTSMPLEIIAFNSATTFLAAFTDAGNYGLMPNISYTYRIFYSE